jgi:hypothetical protein
VWRVADLRPSGRLGGSGVLLGGARSSGVGHDARAGQNNATKLLAGACASVAFVVLPGFQLGNRRAPISSIEFGALGFGSRKCLRFEPSSGCAIDQRGDYCRKARLHWGTVHCPLVAFISQS